MARTKPRGPVFTYSQALVGMESALFVDNLPVQTPTDMICRRTGDVTNRHHIDSPILKLYHVDMSLGFWLLLATNLCLTLGDRPLPFDRVQRPVHHPHSWDQPTRSQSWKVVTHNVFKVKLMWHFGWTKQDYKVTEAAFFHIKLMDMTCICRGMSLATLANHRYVAYLRACDCDLSTVVSQSSLSTSS